MNVFKLPRVCKSKSCAIEDNPYAEVEKCPQAARICKWYEVKT